MKLTFDTIRQLVMEELANVVNENTMAQKVFAILDGSWEQGMLLASGLEEEDRSEFMKMVSKYVENKLKEAAKKAKQSTHLKRKEEDLRVKMNTATDPRYQAEFELSLYNPYEQDYFDKTLVRLRKEDGMFDVDFHNKPTDDQSHYLFNMPKRELQTDLGLEDVLKKINLLYTQGDSPW